MARARPSVLAGAEPLPPRRKWRAILLATLALVPAQWALLAGLVSLASEDRNAPPPAPFIAFGLALIPFVFLVLAFLSEHPRAAGAVVKAMALSLLVGIPISALAADAVTGLVAAVGAGGVVALRSDQAYGTRARALGVVVVTVYVFVLLRTVGDIALLLAPALPFTSIGVADHLSERRAERRAARV
ncbi:MAG TPA: hypothetical protein VGR41_10475 [Actinomycetota bacterium]|jgi:hypothetical protein|nr:hypothetical protein [Actinomycetota bacterium]